MRFLKTCLVGLLVAGFFISKVEASTSGSNTNAVPKVKIKKNLKLARERALEKARIEKIAQAKKDEQMVRIWKFVDPKLAEQYNNGDSVAVPPRISDRVRKIWKIRTDKKLQGVQR